MLDSEFSNQLKEIVGASYVQDSKADRLAYSYDATPNFQQMPDAIVTPRTAEEVQQIVKLCASYKVPIVPRGSGTNLCAGTCPTQGGLVILFTRMNQLLEIDEENLTATVQPGLITQELIHQVEEKGLFYPPDPSSMKISTLGGNINENSGDCGVKVWSDKGLCPWA